jgi:hypothetical protein
MTSKLIDALWAKYSANILFSAASINHCEDAATSTIYHAAAITACTNLLFSPLGFAPHAFGMDAPPLVGESSGFHFSSGGAHKSWSMLSRDSPSKYCVANTQLSA